MNVEFMILTVPLELMAPPYIVEDDSAKMEFVIFKLALFVIEDEKNVTLYNNNELETVNFAFLTIVFCEDSPIITTLLIFD